VSVSVSVSVRKRRMGKGSKEGRGVKNSTDIVMLMYIDVLELVWLPRKECGDMR
jgi:hypothetical protein